MRRIGGNFSGVLIPQTTSPHTPTGETLLYTRYFAGCPAKFAFMLKRDSKLAYFWHFFGFSDITSELFNLEEGFSLLKFGYHREASFPTIFSRIITEKTAKIVKFTKIRQTLKNSYLKRQKRNRVKINRSS